MPPRLGSRPTLITPVSPIARGVTPKICRFPITPGNVVCVMRLRLGKVRFSITASLAMPIVQPAIPRPLIIGQPRVPGVMWTPAIGLTLILTTVLLVVQTAPLATPRPPTITPGRVGLATPTPPTGGMQLSITARSAAQNAPLATLPLPTIFQVRARGVTPTPPTGTRPLSITRSPLITLVPVATALYAIRITTIVTGLVRRAIAILKWTKNTMKSLPMPRVAVRPATPMVENLNSTKHCVS